MHEGTVVRLLIAYGRAAHSARRRPLTPAVMRHEVFARLPRSVRYGLAVEYTSDYLRVTFRDGALASVANDGSLAWTWCAIPPGTKGHEEFRAAVATLASTWMPMARATCGRKASPRRRARRSSRAGPSGDDGSGLSDSDCLAGRAETRLRIAAGVAS